MSSRDDSDPPTPIRSSGAYPLWRNEARDLAAKLDAIGTPAARLLAAEMRRFEAAFAAWSPTNRPTDDERVALIGDFVTANRKALDLLSRR